MSSLRITSDPFEALDEAGQMWASGFTTPPRPAGGGAAVVPGAPQRLACRGAAYSSPPTTAPGAAAEVFRLLVGGGAEEARMMPLVAGGASEDPVTPPVRGPAPPPGRGLGLMRYGDAGTPTATSAAGTPPGSPLPAPMWRTGSCGESGPFIGLGYGWTCELDRRWARAGHGADVFMLKAEMLDEMSEEPDLLRDFTVQEVLNGMANYSWSTERTMEMLSGLAARREAEEEARMAADRAAAAAAAPAAAPPAEPWHRDPAWAASQWR